jgi:hypothetical protein
VGDWADEEVLDFETEDQRDEVGEEILRQLMSSLDTGVGGGADMQESPAAPASAASPASSSSPPPHVPAAPAPPPFSLPDLEAVTLNLAMTRGASIDPPRPSMSGGGPSYGWTPRTPAEVERDAKVGQRGEELIYRREIERVRAMGYDNPEALVTWTSATEPGADHDIRSIDAEGNPCWIEVKSTTGVDGRFEWSRKEFEKALRERGSYELWRVYNVASVAPVAKCFPDPTALVGLSKIAIELGTLRANIEGIN